MFLLLIQFFVLLLIYLIYFRSDGGNLNNAMKILKGLNSDTFNYLETNKKKLNVNGVVPSFIDTWNADKYAEVKKQMPLIHDMFFKEINTVRFFSQCVRYNKPCLVH